MIRSLILLPLMVLAACGQTGHEKTNTDGTEITINADGKDGKVKITSGQDGSKLVIDGDGVAINMGLPDFSKIDISDDFDIDGVKLYPGSKITSVNVDASDKGGSDKATVRIGFTTPTTPTKAAEWMTAEFGKQEVQVTRNGTLLTGKTEDGDDFTIRFDPAGATAKGEALIVSKR